MMGNRIIREDVIEWIDKCDPSGNTIPKKDIIQWVRKSCPDRGRVMQWLSESAIRYVNGNRRGNGVLRNCHMNNLNEDSVVEPDVIDAAIVDFINHFAMEWGIDYGLYAHDLHPHCPMKSSHRVYCDAGGYEVYRSRIKTDPGYWVSDVYAREFCSLYRNKQFLQNFRNEDEAYSFIKYHKRMDVENGELTN